jgi:hypothetical protein
MHTPVSDKSGADLEQFVGVFGYGRLQDETDDELRKRFLDDILAKAGC